MINLLVSSTCYDLKAVRSTIKTLFGSFGYNVSLSEHGDLLYSTSEHSHRNCLDAINNNDIVVVIIGKRFGGKIIPAIGRDIAKMVTTDVDLFRSHLSSGNLSITQAEAITAFEAGKQVLVFVDEEVDHYLSLYQENIRKGVDISKVAFPGISSGTAEYIFEFINYIKNRAEGNSYLPFSNLDDLTDKLVRQLNMLFKDLIIKQGVKEKRQDYTDYVASGEFVASKIVKHTSIERSNSFTNIFSTIDQGDEIRILGTGVTKFLLDRERVEGLLENGNTIKILLINDKLVKGDWSCSSKEFVEKVNLLNEQKEVKLLTELEAKNVCPLSDLNVLIDQNHFLNYYQRSHYLHEMHQAYSLIKEYADLKEANCWTGELVVKHFFSFVPISITAIYPIDEIQKKLVAEFIIPFTEKRLLIECSNSENNDIHDLFSNFFEETWDKSKPIIFNTLGELRNAS